MSKAEQRAFKEYPPKYVEQKRNPKRVQSEKVDTHQPTRTIYIKGYRQAEKDLALTIDDIEKIHTFLYAVKNNKQGVLKRFNSYGKKKV